MFHTYFPEPLLDHSLLSMPSVAGSTIGSDDPQFSPHYSQEEYNPIKAFEQSLESCPLDIEPIHSKSDFEDVLAHPTGQIAVPSNDGS